MWSLHISRIPYPPDPITNQKVFVYFHSWFPSVRYETGLQVYLTSATSCREIWWEGFSLRYRPFCLVLFASVPWQQGGTIAASDHEEASRAQETPAWWERSLKEQQVGLWKDRNSWGKYQSLKLFNDFSSYMHVWKVFAPLSRWSGTEANQSRALNVMQVCFLRSLRGDGR